MIYKYILYIWVFVCFYGVPSFCKDTAGPVPQNVQEVYLELVRNIGSLKPAPSLVIAETYKKGDKLIYYLPKPSPTIYITRELIEFCGTYGKMQNNLLACLLGHELGHHFLDHGATEFLSIFESRELRKNISAKDASLEEEADAFGLVYGFMAGFNTIDHYEELLSGIRQRYFTSSSATDFERRSRAVASKIEELKVLAACYEAGHILAVSQNFNLSNVCFRFISGKFPTREVLNAMATNHLNRVLEARKKNEDFYAYPIEFDESFRLKQKSIDTRGTEDLATKEEIDQWIDSAKQLLRKAVSISKNYTTAQQNLAIAYLLEENPEAALGIIKEMEAGPDELPANAQLVRAIAYANMGNKEQANKYFKWACDQGAFRCAYNYSLFKKRTEYLAAANPFADYLTQLKNWVYDYFSDEDATQQSPKFFDYDFRDACFRTELPVNKEINIGDINNPFVIKRSASNVCAQLTIMLPAGRLEVRTLKLRSPLAYDESEKPDFRMAGTGGREYLYFKYDGIVLEVSDGRVRSISRIVK